MAPMPATTGKKSELPGFQGSHGALAKDKIANAGGDMHPVAPRKENICAVIVSYFPDAEFAARVGKVLPQVGHVVIVDNTPEPEASNKIERALRELDGIDFAPNHRNLGIARALNQGVEWAIEHGFAWALLLDQDTTPFEDMVAKQIGVYDEFPAKMRLAIVGCDPSPGSAPHDPSVTHVPWELSKAVITSGSLLRLEVVETIGAFREEFFIDCVDFEFCLRAVCAGFDVVEVKEALIRHKIGNPIDLPIRWLAKATSNHQPWRTYFIFRNLVMLAREYARREPLWIWTAIYRRAKLTLLMLLFEDRRLQKLKYTVLGLYDGITSRFDRTVT